MDRIDTPTHPAAPTIDVPQILTAQTIGYRIMREIEAAPGWWGTPREVGDTVSAQVANEYCAEQNAVTMNTSRDKMHRYFADPIYAEIDSDPDMDEALRRVRAPRQAVAA